MILIKIPLSQIFSPEFFQDRKMMMIRKTINSGDFDDKFDKHYE